MVAGNMATVSNQEEQRAMPGEAMQAHRLEGDLDKFAHLELVDPGEPKTTDLDTVHHHQDQSLAFLNNSVATDDDLITVKYLPLKMSSREDEKNGDKRNELDQESNPAPNEQHQSGGLNEEAKVRIVEHIRKNLTLFETNRQVYEVCPPVYHNSNIEHNRGHLQSLLVQKQQNSNRPQVHFSQPHLPRTSHDQYTQYRPSDLIAGLTNYQQQQPKLIQPATCNQTNTQSATRKTDPKILGVPVQASGIGGKSRTLQTRSGTTLNRRREKSASLRRSVSSINDLLKRPIEFVKRAKDNHLKRSDVVVAEKSKNERLKEEEEGEEEESRYKIPVKHQELYTCSQNLYLTPAPDYTVHIATRLVKDIIWAHQRYLERQKLSGLQKQPITQIRLNKLFKTSYSFRRSNRTRKSTPNLELTQPKGTTNPTRTILTRRSRAEYRTEKEPTIDHSISKIKAKVKMPSNKTDRAIISDSKDGTIKISYEPKEVGQHEIALRYNDEPIDESPIVFYVDAIGSSKKKVTAYGPGLSHGSVGDPCKFTINTGGLGSAKLNVSVEGPSKSQVSLNDNKDGTISCGFTPMVPGEYKIKISFDGKQVIGSPFTTQIGDEGRQRSILSVGRGSEHTLDLKVSVDDLKTLNAVIVTPCGLEEPCALKLLQNGQLAIIFTPREQGDHSVSVKRRGNHISGSPFKFDVLSRDIGDAKQVKVSGKNLKEGKANADNEIVINTREAGYGGLSVALEGPGKSEISSKEATDGSIKLIYKPYEPGFYSLSIKYADHVVPGSPFNIKVGGTGTNPQKEILRKFRKVAEIVDVDTECHFTFKSPGVSAYDLSARIHSPHGNSEDASIKDNGDFVYQVSFTPKEVGLYALSIRNKDIHIGGSPFPVTVGPLLEFGPHKVRCGGPGLIRGICGKMNEFNVFTREAGAGEMMVIVEGPSKAELSYTDRKDGSCHVGYKVAEPGEYRISVLFNEHEVPDSPFRAFIMPNKGDVAKIELGPMPPENMIQLNKPCNMTVIMNGAKGNIEGTVILPSGNKEDCFASPIDAENWGVRFIPRELGIHQVHIKFNKGSSHIPQSPIFIQVGHDKADPAAVLAHGHGLKGAIVNHATDFTIETCNAGHALLDVNIEGPSKVSMSCAEIDEGYKIDYTPLVPGDYIISIKYNGCHIGSSPYKIRAIKQPGSRSVADAGSHEVSSISVSTTDREAKQKVENMPKFKSDATRVYCKGMGLKKAFAGKPNTLTVNCSEAGFNIIYASFLGPTRNTIHECSVKHMGGSIFEVKYTCKDRGDAILVVKYGDEQIPGSPFRLECV